MHGSNFNKSHAPGFALHRPVFGPITVAMLTLLTGFAQPMFAQEASDGVESFFWLPDDIISMSHNGKAFLPASPQGIALLEEPRINSGLALTLKVRNQQGEVIGFASELEVFPGDGAAFGGEVLLVWETVWTVTIPGRGSLFLHQQEQENRRVTEEIIGPVLQSGGKWEGDMKFQTSVGPGPNGYGIIVGGTGDFADASGCFIEVDQFKMFEAGGKAHLLGELRILPDC